MIRKRLSILLSTSILLASAPMSANTLTQNIITQNGYVTRDQYITSLMQDKYPREVPTMRGVFRDTSNQWIELAYEKGIVRGTGDFKFNPNDFMKKEHEKLIQERLGYSVAYNMPNNKNNSQSNKDNVTVGKETKYEKKEFNTLEVTGNVEISNCKINKLIVKNGSVKIDRDSKVNTIEATGLDYITVDSITIDKLITDSGTIKGKFTEIELTDDNKVSLKDSTYTKLILGSGNYKIKEKLETVYTRETTSILASYIKTLYIENEKQDIEIDCEVDTIEDNGDVDVVLRYDVKTYTNYDKNKIKAYGSITNYKGKGIVTYVNENDKNENDKNENIDYINVKLTNGESLDAKGNTISVLEIADGTLKNATVKSATVNNDAIFVNCKIDDLYILNGDVSGSGNNVNYLNTSGNTTYIKANVREAVVRTTSSALTINGNVDNITVNGGNITITGNVGFVLALMPTYINGKLYS